MAKGSVLYVGGKKPGSSPKVWRGQVLRVLHCKEGGATDEEKIILLRRVEEDWNRVVLKTWLSKTISSILEAKVGGKQAQLGTFGNIKDKVFWKGKKTVIHWGLLPVGIKFESWVITLDVSSASEYMRRHIMNKEKFHVWY